jgi:hypothetical protein
MPPPTSTAIAEGIAAQRRLVLGTDKPWPLGRLG